MRTSVTIIRLSLVKSFWFWNHWQNSVIRWGHSFQWTSSSPPLQWKLKFLHSPLGLWVDCNIPVENVNMTSLRFMLVILISHDSGLLYMAEGNLWLCDCITGRYVMWFLEETLHQICTCEDREWHGVSTVPSLSSLNRHTWPSSFFPPSFQHICCCNSWLLFFILKWQTVFKKLFL